MSSESLHIQYQEEPDDHFMNTMKKGLIAMSDKAKGPWECQFQTYAFSVKDKDGEMIAGLEGYTLYGCLCISNIWIEESHRKQGLGTNLVDKAEKLGRTRGCSFALIITFDFYDVIPFYEKLGYTVEVTMTGFEKDSTKLTLKKSL